MVPGTMVHVETSAFKTGDPGAHKIVAVKQDHSLMWCAYNTCRVSALAAHTAVPAPQLCPEI